MAVDSRRFGRTCQKNISSIIEKSERSRIPSRLRARSMAKTMHSARARATARKSSPDGKRKKKLRYRYRLRFEGLLENALRRALSRGQTRSRRESRYRGDTRIISRTRGLGSLKTKNERKREGGKNFGDICPRIHIGRRHSCNRLRHQNPTLIKESHGCVCLPTLERLRVHAWETGERETDRFDPQYLSDSVIYFPTQFPS